MEFGALFISNVFLIVAMLGSVGMISMGLPGNLLLFFSVLAYAALSGFLYLSYESLAVVLVIILLAESVEFLAGLLGAKKEKASKRAMVGAVFGGFCGALIGSGIVPLVGSVIGLVCGGFLGSYLAEYSKAKDTDKAGRVAVGVAIGQMTGVLTKLILALIAIAYIVSQMPWSSPTPMSL
ncbi:MAG: DUF456 domain-containing protein [Selenomonadales bacterium]|nr:DUF456 domain-containing protein [Selenomonadales bacterium]